MSKSTLRLVTATAANDAMNIHESASLPPPMIASDKSKYITRSNDDLDLGIDRHKQVRRSDDLADVLRLAQDAVDEVDDPIAKSNAFDDWRDNLILVAASEEQSVVWRQILGLILFNLSNAKDVQDYTDSQLKVFRDLTSMLRHRNSTSSLYFLATRKLLAVGLIAEASIGTASLSQSREEELERVLLRALES